jgi:hypothetical protein
MTPSQQSQQLAFTLGQIDAFTRLVMDRRLNEAPSNAILALRLIVRLWAQYCEDRPKLNSARLLLAPESEAIRPAFTRSLEYIAERSPQSAWPPFMEAIATINRIGDTPHPLIAQAAIDQSRADIEQLEILLPAIGSDAHQFPVDVLTGLAQQFADVEIGTKAADDDPCWALNLAIGLNARIVGLYAHPLPFPGVLRRRCLRADLNAAERRVIVADQLALAATRLASDHYRCQRLGEAFLAEFSVRRATSRLDQAWFVLAGLGSITTRQLARALALSENGARQMLETLVNGGFCARRGPFFEASLNYRFRVDPPHWATISDHEVVMDQFT